MANETLALVTNGMPVAVFLWSRDYGDVFQPISRAKRALGHFDATEVPAFKLMPVGSWLRVAVSRQAEKNGHHWVADVVRRAEAPDARLITTIPPAIAFGPLQLKGIGVVGVVREDVGVLYNPHVGRVLFRPSVLGKKAPPPLVPVEFVARDRSGRQVSPDFVKFEASSLKPYQGPKLDYGVRALRCLGRDSVELMRDVLGLVVEGEPETRIRAETHTVLGLAAGSLKDMEAKAYLVYAVPRPFVAADVPGAPRPCEWEALVVKVDGKRPPAPLSTGLASVSSSVPLPAPAQQAPVPSQPQRHAPLHPRSFDSMSSGFSERTSQVAWVGTPATPKVTPSSGRSAGSAASSPGPFSPDTSLPSSLGGAEEAAGHSPTRPIGDVPVVWATGPQGSASRLPLPVPAAVAQGGPKEEEEEEEERWAVQTELVEAAISDERIFNILSTAYPELLMKYLTLTS